VLFCVQVVQTNNNESNRKKEGNNKFLVQTSKRCVNLTQKKKQKKLIDKIHKLIIKELKLNVNNNIKISKLFPSLIMHNKT
jgi:hypothetical protein